MINTDVIMLVIASRAWGYDNMINHYWSKMINYIKRNNYNNIKIFLIFGNNVDTTGLKIEDDDKLILDVEDSYMPGILNKTIEAFKRINEMYNYKHIIRTNLSSFFIIDNVMRVSNELENTNVYTGVNGQHNGIPFISGAGIWLSKDIVQYIINNNLSLDRNLIDDVSIGKLLINHKKGMLTRYDLTDGNEIHDKDTLIINIINNKYYHIRIKSNKIETDLSYMTRFSDVLYKI